MVGTSSKVPGPASVRGVPSKGKHGGRADTSSSQGVACGTVARTLRLVPWRLGHELWVSWRFVRNDVWSGFCPGVLMTLGVAVHYHLPAARFVGVAASSLAYFWLYLYTFCLTNQLAGLREDQLNKPFRPLVTGEASRRATVWRAVVTFTAFPLVGWALGVWQWALIWEAVTLLHNLGGARHWVVKNAVISLGIPLMLGPAWQMVAPLGDEAWRWMVTLAVSAFVLIPVQDLRDLHGDAATGRMTFPLAFGEPFARTFLCVGFGLLPFVDHFLIIRASPDDPKAWIAEAATAVLCWVIAWRVPRRINSAYDHRTYRWFEYWYAAIVLAAFITL
ncbi:UbiA family prenyltransferase [Streptomyces sp. NBC_00083]|uniref:UbiA family prenyltransferase n=1 Tax=Streptomyces sp. NBC_00083 TaxID=2975647 RepID=UPI00224D7BD9|nr:UbiA family prenyltransferase [Streptomyces sp. NBC_00083]MCX5387292.1 UbiA family prenyltransferase [Streptomyces sp. NBC_00083]